MPYRKRGLDNFNKMIHIEYRIIQNLMIFKRKENKGEVGRDISVKIENAK